jgi:hypothetical protein
MKKILVLLSLAILFIGCERYKVRQERKNHIIKNLSKNNLIRKMFYKEGVQNQTKSDFGGFFVFGIGAGGGGSSSTSILKKTVTFAYKYEDDYIVTSLPLSKIRIRLDKECKQPTVSFKVRTNASFYVINEHILNDTDFKYVVIYARITCHPNMWKVNINMPLEGK